MLIMHAFSGGFGETPQARHIKDSLGSKIIGKVNGYVKIETTSCSNVF